MATDAAADQVYIAPHISLRGGGSGARRGSSVGGEQCVFLFFSSQVFHPLCTSIVLFLRVMGLDGVGSLVGTRGVHTGYVLGGKTWTSSVWASLIRSSLGEKGEKENAHLY